MAAIPSKKNPAIQSIDYGIIQLNKAKKLVTSCETAVYVKDVTKNIVNRLSDLHKQRKLEKKQEHRRRHIQGRLNDLYARLGTLHEDNNVGRAEIEAEIHILVRKLNDNK